MLGRTAGSVALPRSGRTGPAAWTRYPCQFPTWVLEAAVQAARVPVGGLVLDPFVGAGGAGFYLTGRGDRFIGIDAHPLMAEAAQVKLARHGPAHELESAADVLLERAGEFVVDVELEPRMLREAVGDRALTELVALREVLDGLESPWVGHLRCAILGALRDCAGPGWPYARRRPARGQIRRPVSFVVDRVQRMVNDLRGAPREPDGRIIAADARQGSTWESIAPTSVDACVTSPPYPNQISYIESTRLELYFTGQAKCWADLRRLSAELLCSCTQQMTAQRSDADALAELPGVGRQVASLAQRLTDAGRRRARPKRYDRLIVRYFADIAQVLGHLTRALAPGGRAAWVIGDSAPYGVHVDTPSLTAAIGLELGLRVVADELLRSRGEKWAGVGARHSQPLAERLIVFERPAWAAPTPLPGLEDV